MQSNKEHGMKQRMVDSFILEGLQAGGHNGLNPFHQPPQFFKKTTKQKGILDVSDNKPSGS